MVFLPIEAHGTVRNGHNLSVRIQQRGRRCPVWWFHLSVGEKQLAKKTTEYLPKSSITAKLFPSLHRVS